MAAGTTVVWTGRGSPGTPRGLDGWNTTADDLKELLAGARELVVTDALSFPWRNLTTEHRAIPFTVTLPSALDADELLLVLQRPVLRHITRFDRLVEDRADVREWLTDALDLPEVVWIEGADEAADGSRRDVSKARMYEAVVAARHVLLPLVRGRDTPPLLGFLGHAREIGGPVSSALGVPHATYGLDAAADDPPAPHAIVLQLTDGGQPVEERAALMGRARDLLHPGGILVVVGHVVTAPGGAAANPSIARLVEELDATFGGMIQVREVQSVHWRGESMTRGVIVGAVSLHGGAI